MTHRFSFPQPDGQLHTADIDEIFSTARDGALLRAYCMDHAARFPDTCDCLIEAANAIYRDRTGESTGFLPTYRTTDRIGAMLAQQLYYHARQDDTYADIWGEVSNRLAESASGSAPDFHIFIIRRPDDTQ